MPDEPQASQRPKNGSADIYPTLHITPPIHPNRLYAVPIFGMTAKFILLTPFWIWITLVGVSTWVLLLINSFIVLFSGKYWPVAETVVRGYFQLIARFTVYLYGFSDRYPWFSLKDREWCSVHITAPAQPNRLFAIPFGGGVVRWLLMIPFSFFTGIVSGGVGITIGFIAWAVVLFTGKYPESVFELGRDAIRLTLSLNAYTAGLSDHYPSFSIDLSNQRNQKIAIIIAGVLLQGWSWFNNIGGMFTALNTANSIR